MKTSGNATIYTLLLCNFKLMKKYIVLFLLLAYSGASLAQVVDYTQDVQSVDNIMAALYNVISGEAGESRDWNRFKNLFTGDARLIPTSKTKEGKISYAYLSPADYVQLFQSRIATGFFEKELHRLSDEYGTIVQVFSTYETRESKNGPVTNRGINSIQLLKTHDRYYIMNIFWCGENTGFMVPEHYLTGRKE
jgi:hypothetical protein